MLVRLGAAADSVPAGQRIVRARVPRSRSLPAPPPTPNAAPSSEQETVHEAYLHDGPAAELEHARRVERACAAYQAADLIQPTPGLIIRVRA